MASAFAFYCANGTAQTAAAPNEDSRLTRDPATGAYNFSWWGQAGRTYFLQQSENLTQWTYLPVIESGAGQVIRWGTSSSAARSFMRLRYSDLPTTDPFESDFDHDGIKNYEELLIGTDPLSWHDGDSTHAPNGLPDDWELYHFGVVGINPAADPDGDGRTNLQEYQLGSDPNDSSNGRMAQLAKVSGDLQDGYTAQGSTLVPATLAPIKVRVTEASTGTPYPGVAVSFASTADGQVSATPDPGASWQEAVSVLADAGGYASAWVKMPAAVPRIDQFITASVPGTGIAEFVVKTPNGTDRDRNGLADAWEMTNFGSLGHDAAGDDDQDGLSNAEEMAGGTHPNNVDSDGDGVADGRDALPLDSDFTFPYRPVSRYAVVNLGAFKPVALNNRGQAVGYDASGNPAVWSKGQIYPIPPLDPALLEYHYYDYVLTAGPGAALVGISDEGVIAANQDFYTPDSLRYVLHTAFTVRFDAATGVFSSPVPLKGLYSDGRGTPNDPTRVYVSGMSPNGNLIGASEYYYRYRTFHPFEGPPVDDCFTTVVHCAWLPPNHVPQRIPNFPDANDQETLTFPNEPGYTYYDGQGLLSDHASFYGPCSITNSGKVLTTMNESTDPEMTINVFHALLGDAPAAVPIELGVNASPASFNEHLQLAVGVPYHYNPFPIPSTIWFKKDGSWSMKTLPGIPPDQQNPFLSRKPTKINDLGQVLVQYDSYSSYQALWQNGKLQNLSELAGKAGGYSLYGVADLNNLGMMVGSAGYQAVDAQGNPQGNWEERGVMLIPFDLVDSKDPTLDDGNDVYITPKKDAADESPACVAWIDPHGTPDGKDPEMPWLVLRLFGTDQMDWKIKWKLKVVYKRPNGRTLAEDTVTLQSGGQTPDPGALDGAIEIYDHASWKAALQEKGFFGGDAELTFQVFKGDGIKLSEETTANFRIGGRNPDNTKARDYLTGTQPDLWFAYAICKHETSEFRYGGTYYNQFVGNPNGKSLNYTTYKRKFPLAYGEPTWNWDYKDSKPGGFGLFQVTGWQGADNGDVPRNVIWNWQRNMTEGANEIRRDKAPAATNYFNAVKSKYGQNIQNPPITVTGKSRNLTGWEVSVIVRYNGLAGTPPHDELNADLGKYTQDPWTYSDRHWGGPKPNKQNYLSKVISEIE